MTTLLATTTRTLPDGFSARAGCLDDYLTAFELFNVFSMHVNNSVDLLDPEVLRNDWMNAGFNPETDVLLVFEPEGRLVGLLETWLTHIPQVHPWNWICVHPDYFGHGIWEYLLEMGEARSTAALDLVQPELRISMRTGTTHNVPEALQAYDKLGWKYIRSYYRMIIEFDSEPEVPEAPEGIIVRRFHPETEAEAVYRATAEAFKDHFGVTDQPFEEGFAEFKHNMIDEPGFDPDYWFLAMDGDEIAGICLCRPESHEDAECGFVNDLAVRRPWRKQGIGYLLLKTAFAAFYAHGQRKAALGVDATNLTGALRLYERAGMHVMRQMDNFEKELRPGREISTQELE